MLFEWWSFGGAFCNNMIPVGKAMDEAKLQKYKTVLCQRMLRSGTCRYGLQCDFAHDKLELRRNLQQHWYYGQKCTKESCEDNECRYAHNDMELLYHPHIFKTQLCHSIAFGPCLKKHYCPFAHGPEELRQGKLETEEDPSGESRLFFLIFRRRARRQLLPQQRMERLPAVQIRFSIPHRLPNFAKLLTD